MPKKGIPEQSRRLPLTWVQPFSAMANLKVWLFANVSKSRHCTNQLRHSGTLQCGAPWGGSVGERKHSCSAHENWSCQKRKSLWRKHIALTHSPFWKSTLCLLLDVLCNERKKSRPRRKEKVEQHQLFPCECHSIGQAVSAQNHVEIAVAKHTWVLHWVLYWFPRRGTVLAKARFYTHPHVEKRTTRVFQLIKSHVYSVPVPTWDFSAK